jgi:hypothetical protein
LGRRSAEGDERVGGGIDHPSPDPEDNPLRKLIIGAITTVSAVLMVLGFVAGAQAEPGPNGENDHGLCTAFFNGQKNGHDKNGNPGPFAALVETGEAYTDNDGVDNDRDGEVDEEDEHSSLSDAENVFNYCNDNDLIGGNPDHGRYTCTDDGSGDSDPNCEDNPAPGNS